MEKNSYTATKKISLACGAQLICIPNTRLTKIWIGLRFRGGQIFEKNEWQTQEEAASNNTPPQGSFSLLSDLLEGSNTILSKKEMVAIRKINAIDHTGIAGECSFGFNLAFLSEKSNHAMQIAKAALSLKKINTAEFEFEKNETLHEIARAEESGERMASRSFNKIFLANSPFKNPVTGTKSIAKKLKISQLEKVWNNFRSPKNCVVVLAGSYTNALQENLQNVINASLNEYKNIKKKKIISSKVFINRFKNINTRLFKETHTGNKQTYVKLGYALPSFTSKQSLIAKVLQSYLSGMGGPLFKLRSEPYSKNGVDLGGRAYVMGSRLASAYHYGGLIFYTSLREEARDEWGWALNSFKKEIELLKNKKLSHAKIEEAKNALLAARNLQLGKVSFRAAQYAAYEILNLSYKLWEEDGERLKKIKQEDVLLFCRKYLTSNNCVAHISQQKI